MSTADAVSAAELLEGADSDGTLAALLQPLGGELGAAWYTAYDAEVRMGWGPAWEVLAVQAGRGSRWLPSPLFCTPGMPSTSRTTISLHFLQGNILVSGNLHSGIATVASKSLEAPSPSALPPLAPLEGVAALVVVEAPELAPAPAPAELETGTVAVAPASVGERKKSHLGAILGEQGCGAWARRWTSP